MLIEDSQNLLPMRLQNASSSLTAPLVFPPGVILPQNAPVTKRDLLDINRVFRSLCYGLC
jgi:hypothetical protein